MYINTVKVGCLFTSFFIHILTTKAKPRKVPVTKTRWLAVRKYIDNLMFCSEELSRAFRLHNIYRNFNLSKLLKHLNTNMVEK